VHPLGCSWKALSMRLQLGLPTNRTVAYFTTGPRMAVTGPGLAMMKNAAGVVSHIDDKIDRR